MFFKFSQDETSSFSRTNLSLRLLSTMVGFFVALTMLVLISGCAAHPSKPLPMYQQIEVPTVKAYQDEVNHTQNYVYRADNITLLKSLNQTSVVAATKSQM